MAFNFHQGTQLTATDSPKKTSPQSDYAAHKVMQYWPILIPAFVTTLGSYTTSSLLVLSIAILYQFGRDIHLSTKCLLPLILPGMLSVIYQNHVSVNLSNLLLYLVVINSSPILALYLIQNGMHESLEGY